MSFVPHVDGPREPTLAGPQEIPDPRKLDMDRSEAKRRALRAMNALKIVNPLLCAIAETSSGVHSNEEAAKIFKELVSQVGGVSSKIVLDLGLDSEDASNFWIRNSIERALAEILREQWVKSKSSDLSYLDKALDSLIRKTDPAEPQWESFPDMNLDLQMRCAIIKSGATFIHKTKGTKGSFDFFRNLDEELERITKNLVAVSSRACIELLDSKASEKDKAMLFSIVLQEATGLYCTCWWVVGKKSVDQLAKLTNKELAALMKEHPEGLPLNEVEEMFDKNFARLVGLANKLVPQKSGKIDQRLKIKG